jgi:HTH-type transcriptional regulator / antitoxin HigA
MAAPRAFDLSRYQKLIFEAAPRPPETEEENDRLIAYAETLRRQDNLAPEEQTLLDMLVLLIEDFEGRYYRTKQAAPHEVLRELIRARDLQPKDLWSLFGSRGITSETLKGKRGISKEKAKALAELFRVPVDIFL